MQEINEHLIQIQGKASIEKELKIDRGYQVVIREAVCTDILEKTNNDGTHNKLYKLKIFSDVELIGEKEVLIGLIKKGSQAQVLRQILTDRYYTEQPDMELEDFYKQEMSRIIQEEKNKVN